MLHEDESHNLKENVRAQYPAIAYQSYAYTTELQEKGLNPQASEEPAPQPDGRPNRSIESPQSVKSVAYNALYQILLVSKDATAAFPPLQSVVGGILGVMDIIEVD